MFVFVLLVEFDLLLLEVLEEEFLLLLLLFVLWCFWDFIIFLMIVVVVMIKRIGMLKNKSWCLVGFVGM